MAASEVAGRAAEIQTWFQDHIATLIGVSADEIPPDTDFDSFGIDSVQGVDMLAELESWLGVPDELPVDIIFEADSLAGASEDIARFVAARIAQA